MESPRRLRPRASMPHVATQWQSSEDQRGSYDVRLSTTSAKKSTEYLRPIAIPPSRPASRHPRQSPSISLMPTPENDRWDFGSIRHIRQYSSESRTPISAVDSVFELPSATSSHSSNSSIHSSFIAELEDTSSMAIHSLKPLPLSTPKIPVESPALAYSGMEFKSAEITSRAVIKVVDETIAAIEDANRKLLSRAVAAEEAAKRLREQNTELELRISQFSNNHRPKTAPNQPARTRHHERSPSTSYTQSRNSQMPENHDSTPLSAFNAQIDKLVLPSKRDSRPREPPPFPAAHQHSRAHSLSIPISAPAYIDLAPNTTTSHGLGLGFPAPPKHHHRPPPRPLQQPSSSHSHSYTHCHTRSHNDISISAPIPGSVSRHEVTYQGTPLSLSTSQRAKNISLEEARRRAKPLPPLGPMSPSVLKGVVEIGSGERIDEWRREGKNDNKEEAGKGKRVFSGLFRWKREKENIF